MGVEEDAAEKAAKAARGRLKRSGFTGDPFKRRDAFKRRMAASKGARTGFTRAERKDLDRKPVSEGRYRAQRAATTIVKTAGAAPGYVGTSGGGKLIAAAFAGIGALFVMAGLVGKQFDLGIGSGNFGALAKTAAGTKPVYTPLFGKSGGGTPTTIVVSAPNYTGQAPSSSGGQVV